jgi:hypothetical protein
MVPASGMKPGREEIPLNSGTNPHHGVFGAKQEA